MGDRKIVFFDIDGTIYKFIGGIPKDTMESIRKLKKNGHIPVLCTGRTKIMIYDEFLEPGFDYIIGGAGTYLEMEGKQIFNYEMESREIEKVTKGFVKYGFSPVIEGRDDIYVEYINEKRSPRANKIIHNYRKNLGRHCRDIYDTEEIAASKISGAFMPGSNPDGIREEFGDSFTVIDHNGDLLELVPKGFSKATGIEFLINKLGISIEDTYAFGDSFNDLEMLQYVKYGVAMGNSDPDLFQYTKYRTEDFDKGGVTNALKRFGMI